MEQISDKMTTATNSNPTTSSSSDAAVKHFKDAYLELRRQQNPDLDEFMLLLHKVHTEPLIASAVGVERVPLLVNNEQQTSSSSSESSLVKPPTSKPMVAVPPTSRHSVSTAPPITSTTSNNNNSLAGSLRDPNADPIQLSQALIERLRAVNSSTSVSSTLAAAAAAAASASSNNTASISSPSRTIRSAVGSGSVGVGLTGSGVAGGAPGGLLRSSRSSINLSSSARGSRSDLTSAAGGGSGATTGMVDAEVSRAIKDVVVDGGGDSVGGGGGLFRARSFSANNISEVAASGDQSLSASNFSSSMLLDGSTLLGSLTPNADKSRQHPTLRFSSPSKTTKISTPKKQAMTMKSSLHKGVLFQSTSGAAGASSRTGTKGGSSTSSSNATAVTPILTDIGTLSLEQQEAFISDDVLYALLVS